MRRRAPPSKELDLEAVAKAAAGVPRFDRHIGLRPAGLLARLAGSRLRTTQASSLVGGSVEQVHSGTPLQIGTRLGNFDVTGVLQRDSSGIVYAAEDRSLLRKIAIKEYLPAMLADRMANGKVGVRSLRYQQSFRDGKNRFLSEARMLADLDEPALVKVSRFWKQHGTAYMAMPLYEGQTLNDILRAAPKPGEAWLKAMLGPLLDALATLHKFDCYPCDVTPDNIVVLDDGTPLLFAFGPARRVGAGTTGDFGRDLNPGFAAIEQYADDPTMPVGPWTDIYAVAAVVHFAITGKPLPAPATRMVSDTLPPLREANKSYSDSFLDAVDRGLAVHPRQRPQTIAEFRAALRIPSLTSGEMPRARLAPLPAAASTHAATASMMPATRPQDMPVPISTVVRAPPPVPEQTVAIASSSVAVGSSLSAAPWKLVVPLIVVGLVLIVAGFVTFRFLGPVGEPRPSAPVTIDRAVSLQPAQTGAQPTPAVATLSAPTESQSQSVSAPVATPATVPPVPVPPVSAPTAPRTGKVRFSIKPWGEIIVDGRARGVSPPIKELAIPEGRHRIEIRNGAFPGYESQLDIRAGSSDSISYSFKAP